MPATTFEKTWQFDMNRAYTPSNALDLTRYTMWYIAAVLTGNLGGMTGASLWTLYASSNSSTAGTDATDRWVLAGPYDGTKIVRGSGSNAHSWIVLRSGLTMNGIQFYMILSFNTSTDAAIRLSYCKAAPTGGSTTVTPTASPSAYPRNQWSPNGAGSITDYTINAAVADASRFNLGLANDGSFYFLACKQTAGVANLSIQFHALSDYLTADKYPVWAMTHYRAAGANATNTGAFQALTTVTGSHDPQSSGSSIANVVLRWGFSTTSVYQPSSAGIDGAWLDLPVIIAAESSAPNGVPIRGRVADLGLTLHATGLNEGDTAPSGGPVDSSVAGGFWYPANAAFNFS